MPLRICITTTAFPRWPDDGQGAFVWELAHALTRQGCSVRVVAMHSPGTSPREMLDGIEVVRPRYLRPERWELLRKGGSGGLPITWKRHPWVRLQMLPFALVHTLASARFGRESDVVHAQWTLSGGAAALGRWLHRRPVVVTLHGSDVFQAARAGVGRAFARWVLRHCDRIVTVSQALAEEACALGADPARVQVIPNGIDIQRFCPPDEPTREPVVLYVGSFIERKGLRYLIDAMPAVLSRQPAYRLVLVGEGPQQAELAQQAIDLGIASQVQFVPFLPHDEVRAWMQRASLFVLPSTEEGMGVVLLEALACGTPVVASRTGGIVDVVTPEVGALVAPAHAGQISEAVGALLGDPARWQQASQAARARAEQVYAWDRVARRFVELYRGMVKA